MSIKFKDRVTSASNAPYAALNSHYRSIRGLLCTFEGMMVTTKQRQEFRIQLQRRACRRAEKKIEMLEDDMTFKEVAI